MHGKMKAGLIALAGLLLASGGQAADVTITVPDDLLPALTWAHAQHNDSLAHKFCMHPPCPAQADPDYAATDQDYLRIVVTKLLRQKATDAARGQ